MFDDSRMRRSLRPHNLVLFAIKKRLRLRSLTRQHDELMVEMGATGDRTQADVLRELKQDIKASRNAFRDLRKGFAFRKAYLSA